MIRKSNCCVLISLILLIVFAINGESWKSNKKLNLRTKTYGEKCGFKFENNCDSMKKYRNLDGSCNNLANGWWGKSRAPYKRWLKPDYSDELNEPRVSVNRSELPSPRTISCRLHVENNQTDSKVNHLFMQWGQFISIDITGLAKSKDECSTCQKTDQCYPIKVYNDESCPKLRERNCIEFVRSVNTFKEFPECIREQLNLQTSFIDGSVIYGLDDDTSRKLRDSSIKGNLKMTSGIRGKKNENLPIETYKTPCLKIRHEFKCFNGGDERLNMLPGFGALQTILVREHNRIADILSNLNPNWDDDKVFEETRRIIIAIIQHITYNEYLPILLDEQTLYKYKLFSDKTAPFLYNSNIDPRVANEYSTSAGRFGHSLIRSKTSVRDNFYQSIGPDHLLHNDFFSIRSFYNQTEGGLESILRGYLSDPSLKVDRYFTSEVTQHLFSKFNTTTNQVEEADLVSMNLQRGREHGIPSYTKFRQFCSLSKINSWNDLKNDMPSDAVDILQNLYNNVDDIDLFTASVIENPTKGSLVGPTLNCLIGLQFYELKFGDRFWYETLDGVVAFTSEQVNEIKKISLSKLLCNNMNDNPLILPEAFLLNNIASNNSLVVCSNFQDIDWSFWKEEKKENGSFDIDSFLKDPSDTLQIPSEKSNQKESLDDVLSGY